MRLKSFTGLALEQQKRHFPPQVCVCVSSENPYCSHVGSIKISLHCPLARDALLHIIKNISRAVIKIAAL